MVQPRCLTPARQMREASRWLERWRYSGIATERVGMSLDSGGPVRGGVAGAGRGISTAFGKALAADGEKARATRTRGSLPTADASRSRHGASQLLMTSGWIGTATASSAEDCGSIGQNT